MMFRFGIKKQIKEAAETLRSWPKDGRVDPPLISLGGSPSESVCELELGSDGAVIMTGGSKRWRKWLR